MIIVTLDIFSGMPNPQWMLSAPQSSALRTLLEPLLQTRAGRASIREKKINSSQLGYRGFTIKGELQIGKNEIIPRRIYGLENIERFLLTTAPSNINSAVLKHVEDQIGFFPDRLSADPSRTKKCPACAAPAAPIFGNLSWKAIFTEQHNNCYNYATNLITNTFAQPGDNAGSPFTAITGTDVEMAAKADGLVSVTGFHSTLPAGHYVALVVWPGMDFHWYRQDAHGCWSHKRGKTSVTELDDNNKYISDPQSCNMGSYVFTTYMISSPAVAVI